MFNVPTQVKRALTHLALSAQEQADFTKDVDSLFVNARRGAL